MAQPDLSILQGIRPVQIDTSRLESPVNQMANIYQLQGAQQANQLRGMQMEAAQRELAQQNFLADVYKKRTTPEGGIDYEGVQRDLASGGHGALIPGLVKTQREAQKVESEARAAKTKAIVDKLALYRDQLDRIDPKSPDAAAQYFGLHNWTHSDADLGPYLQSIGVDQQQAFKRISQAINTGKLPELIELSKVGATKMQERHQPKPQTFDLHDRSVLIDTNPNSPTFKQEISSMKKGKTEHEAEMERISRGNLGIAQKRLEAETSSGGDMTPQTLDMVANLYLQTGQLPALGIGKKAAALKTQILNRATVLGGGAESAAPATPADIAGKVITGKQDVAARTQTVKNFSTGVEGRAVRSFNTAIDHLETMDKLATALGTNDTRAFNTVGNFFSKQTGAPAITNFEAAKAIVGGEVAKALTGSNMALKDREEIRDAITSASSPQQLAGTVKTLKKLLGGQLQSLNVQYETGTGRKDFSSKLTPAAKRELEGLQGGGTSAAPSSVRLQADAILSGGK